MIIISLDSGIQGINLDWPTGKGREWDWELSDMDMGIFYLQLLQAFFLGWSSERKWYLLSTGVYGLQVLFLDDDGHIDP